MTHPCDHNREHMAAFAGCVRPWSEDVEAHLAECEPCRTWAARLALHARALGELQAVSAPAALERCVDEGLGADGRGRRAAAALAGLPRVETPADLEGRVVASLHGGAREERVISELRGVARSGAPADLDRRMEALFVELRSEGRLPDHVAPEELEERLDGDLRDLPETITSRLLQKLERLKAPFALEGRVRDELAREARSASRATPILRFTRRHAAAAGLVAAASLAVWFGLQSPSGGPDAPRNTAAEVVVIDDPALLSPLARDFFDRVTGGALPALRRAERQGLTPEVVLGANGGATRTTTLQGAGGGAAGGPGRVSTSPGASRSPLGGTPLVGGGQGSGGSPQSSGSGPPLFDSIGDAPLTHSFRGVRHVLIQVPSGDFSGQLELREEIATDGQGRFTIVPKEVIVPNISGNELDEFQMMQADREGFFFRSRDFGIRNLTLFWQNYQVLDGGLQMDVAGITASLFDISRLDGRGNLYRVAIDPATGVVLYEEESTRDGALVRQVTYESFAYDANLSDLELSGGPSGWVPFDASDANSVPFELLRPSAPPTGFSFEGAGVVAGYDPSGDTWARILYGDGVEQVFFLFNTDAVLQHDGRLPMSPAGDVIRVMSFGSWTIAEGLVRGGQVLAVGKVGQDELVLMLQSALETE